MNRFQTKALVEGAIFAAITVIIGIVRFYVPVVSIISVVWAVPIIIIAFRHGLRVSITSSIVASVLVSVMTQPVKGIELFISFAIPGIVMGYMLNKKINPTITIFASGMLIAICSALGIALTSIISGISVTQMLNTLFEGFRMSWNQSIQIMTEFNKATGANQDVLKVLPSADEAVRAMKMIIPAGLFLSGVACAFINFKTVKLILKRIGFVMEDIKPFSMWVPNEPIRIGLMASVLVLLLAAYLNKNLMIAMIVANLIAVFTIVFLVLGLSLIAFFLEKNNINKNLKTVLVVVIFFMFQQFLPFLGYVDTAFNVRKWIEKRSGGAA